MLEWAGSTWNRREYARMGWNRIKGEYAVMAWNWLDRVGMDLNIPTTDIMS